MTSLTQRQLNALKTKKKILDTALELFSKKGFDNVTVDEIVEKSESSKGAFYVHFSSKYEIFIEKFKEIDSFYTNFIDTLSGDVCASEKIILLVESQMSYLRDDLGKDLLRTVYMSALVPNKSDYLSNTERQLYKIVFNLVSDGQNAEELKKELSAEELTMLITRCMRGTLYDWQLFDNYDPVHEGVKFIKGLLQGIITNK